MRHVYNGQITHPLKSPETSQKKKNVRRIGKAWGWKRKYCEILSSGHNMTITSKNPQ